MANLVTMPKLSPTMESGVISSWLKKAGEFVESGQVLAEIETDKAVMEYEMVDEGFLREILVEPGQEIRVDTPIAILTEDENEDIGELLAQLKGQAAPPAPESASGPASGPATEQVLEPVALAGRERGLETGLEMRVEPAGQPSPELPPMAPPPDEGAGRDSAPQGTRNGTRIRVSPYARKLAGQGGLELKGLKGSGPGGRIIARDVEAALAAGVVQPVVSGNGQALPPTGEKPSGVTGTGYEDLPLSMMRKAIAARMVESKQSVPHFQLRRKIRAEKLLAARQELNGRFAESAGLKISLNDIIVKACAMALGRHPEVNSQFLGDRIRRFGVVDIAVAVSTPEGLITPVVRNADVRGLADISAEIRALAAKARDKKLTPEEYQGGTFTVSNLGMFGVHEFNAIINPPQAAILAVAGVVEEPVVEQGVLRAGSTMNLTLSSDHRVVDGATAARFMDTLASMLENPLAMLL